MSGFEGGGDEVEIVVELTPRRLALIAVAAVLLGVGLYLMLPYLFPAPELIVEEANASIGGVVVSGGNASGAGPFLPLNGSFLNASSSASGANEAGGNATKVYVIYVRAKVCARTPLGVLPHERIAVEVRDPSGRVVYADQLVTGLDGCVRFRFGILSNSTDLVYTLYASWSHGVASKEVRVSSGG